MRKTVTKVITYTGEEKAVDYAISESLLNYKETVYPCFNLTIRLVSLIDGEKIFKPEEYVIACGTPPDLPPRISDAEVKDRGY